MVTPRNWCRLVVPSVGFLVGLASCGYADPYTGNPSQPPAVVAAITPTPSPGQDLFEEGADKTLVKFPDGLQYTDTKVGKGPVAQRGALVQIQYTLFLANGSRLQSSRDHGQPVGLTLDTSKQQAFPPGLVEGVPGMRVGGKRRLVVPASLGFGDQGQPPIIPPGSTLVFIVELESATKSQ
jgi:FKBP-type peptidyl-prolyl cis-trans isomerase